MSQHLRTRMVIANWHAGQTEDRRQKTEDRRPKTEDGWPKTEETRHQPTLRYAWGGSAERVRWGAGHFGTLAPPDAQWNRQRDDDAVWYEISEKWVLNSRVCWQSRVDCNCDFSAFFLSSLFSVFCFLICNFILRENRKCLPQTNKRMWQTNALAFGKIQISHTN